MASEIHLQTNIAIIWDFDKTLIPGYMQEPLFRHYNVDGRTFWREVNALDAHLRREGNELVARDSLYLNHILAHVREGIFPGLNNRLLRGSALNWNFTRDCLNFFSRNKGPRRLQTSF